MRRAALRLLALAAAASCLCAVAVWNGYPLVYPDTATYVDAGWRLWAPDERLATYGLVARALGLGRSLWPVVAAQALLLAWLVERVFALVARARRAELWALGACALLAAATTASFTVSYALPDALAPALVLALGLLCVADAPRATRLALAAAAVLALAVHGSHLLAGALLLPAGALLGRARWPTLFATVAAGWLAVLGVNWTLARRPEISPAGPAFALARMSGDGTLERVLDARCGEEPWKLCAWRGRLPRTPDGFLWAKDGPLREAGGFRKSRGEHARILAASLAVEPGAQLAAALTGAARALANVRVEAPRPIDAEWTAPTLAAALPGEAAAMAASRQGRGAFPEPILWSWLARLALAASALFLAAAELVPRWRASPCERRLVLFVAAALAANALVCAFLSTPAEPRYATRLAWLLPLCALARLPAAAGRNCIVRCER